jgi:hypothetical protein
MGDGAPTGPARGRRPAGRLAIGIALAAAALQPLAVSASETDQYTLPYGRQFADLRGYFARAVHGALVTAVTETNAAIARSLVDGRPTPETGRLHAPEVIAANVYERVFFALSINEVLDGTVGSDAMRSQYPGLVTAHRPEQHIYDHPLLLIDVTKFVRTFFRSSTINVNGTLFGTDKLVHFVHMGHIYYTSYRGARQAGVPDAEAMSRAVELSSGPNILLSESALLGLWVTGIRSNADLAANYAGLKFYRNLTEPVRIGKSVLPPMLVRDGLYWRLDGRVGPTSDFFTVFITPHWNEALNPNTYAPLVDAVVRSMLQDRCAAVLDWYRDERGRVRDRQQFEAIARELATFYGEPYGHQDDGASGVSIATTCFPATSGAGYAAGKPAHGNQRRPAAETTTARPGGDELGRTALWWAARNGDAETVVRLLAEGANPNAVDADGEGPLHAAARAGHVAVVEQLLAKGADPRAKALYGSTPLHAAVEQSQAGAASALLKGGADVNARDAFGKAPLHQAVLQGDRELAALLLDYGADPTAAYAGRAPAQLAMRGGDESLAAWLVSYRPQPAARGIAAAPAEARPKAYTPLPRMPAKPRRPGSAG